MRLKKQMCNSSDPWNHNNCIIFFVSLLFLAIGCNKKISNESQVQTSNAIRVDTIQIINKIKLQLTKEYSNRYYGLNKYTLDTPKMIVVHYTAIPTLHETLDLFNQDSLASNRRYINKYSPLNVGIHYVVDRNGKIYNLVPDTIITRHTIGFNHVSLGIENIAANENKLTDLQLESNRKLIHFLHSKYPSIEFLIGHHEYNNMNYPHFSLYKSLDKTYKPYKKPDPGDAFMKRLREQLLKSYGLQFKK